MALALTLLIVLIVSLVIDLSPYFLDDRSFAILYVSDEDAVGNAMTDENLEDDELSGDQEPDLEGNNEEKTSDDLITVDTLTNVPISESDMLDGLDDLDDLSTWDIEEFANDIVEEIKGDYWDD